MKKFSTTQIDDDILAEIIGSCEKKMVSPFKKKGVILEVDSELEDEDLEVEDDESESEKLDIKDKLSEMDLDELKALYASIKE